MRELKIFGLEESKNPLILALGKTGAGDVRLQAINSDGNPIRDGTLLILQINGLLHLPSNINKDLDLPLDDDGRLKLTGREEKSAEQFSDVKVSAMVGIREALLKISRLSSDPAALANANYELSVFDKMAKALGHPLN